MAEQASLKCEISVVSKFSKSGNSFDALRIVLPSGYAVDCFDFRAVNLIKTYKSISDALGIRK